MIKKTIIFLSFLFFSLSLSSKEKPTAWFTGPLLTPSANNLEPKKINIQPYLYVTDSFASYSSSWHHHSIEKTISVTQETFVQFGLLDFLDITFDLLGYYNSKKGKHATEFGDLGVSFGIQLLRENSNLPSIRLTIKESFPTGKYKNLNPNKLELDAVGSGSFETIFGLNFSKVAYFIENHPIAFRLVFSYSIPTKTTVKGFNIYGGGYNTSGKIKPSKIFATGASFEFSFTKKFIYAMDFVYLSATSVKFKGSNGIDKDGNPAKNNPPSSDSFSLAPALEYGFTENLGILAGVWFPVRGRNSIDFISYIASLTYTF